MKLICLWQSLLPSTAKTIIPTITISSSCYFVLGITSEITKCCPACFNRITRRLSTENGPETDASSSSSKLVENHEGGEMELFIS